MKNSLIVSETFYSIQGEGQCAGTPAVFLRLAGCNLLCSGSGWVCDTIEVWKHGRSTPFPDVLAPAYIDALKAGAHLVITGGEPLLHQEAIVQFMLWLENERDVEPIYEIETNGTIEPNEDLWGVVNYWNVSFKLSNSGEPYSKRINEVALSKFSGANWRSVAFKIVIGNEADFLELIQDFPGLDYKKVILMPAGATQAELSLTRGIVADLCKAHNLRYSDRLHIVLWDRKTGV